MIKSMEELNREFRDEYTAETTAGKGDYQSPAPDRDRHPGAIINPPRPSGRGDYQSPAPVRGRHAGVTINPPRPLWKDLLILIIKILLIPAAFAILFTFLFGFIRYEEPSMSPAIKDGDIVIFHRYTKTGYLPQDTVIIEYEGQLHARRVVATAGDIVDIVDNGLVINGSTQLEADIYQKTERYAEGYGFPLTVPEGSVFVLADSRTGATDGRVYGPVDIDDTLGKVIAVIRRRGI